MNSSIAKFWWGQKAEERKVHWKSWLSMTMAKDMSGLGFKDLEVFNKALLASNVGDCWKILMLCGLECWKEYIFIGKIFYQPRGEGELHGHGAVYWKGKIFWRRISCGRLWMVKMFQFGMIIGCLVWRVGHPGLMDSQILEKVSEIIVESTGEWRLGEVDHWLTEEQRDAIKVIPIGRQRGEDEMVWPFSKDGKYSAKSWYHKMKQKKVW